MRLKLLSKDGSEKGSLDMPNIFSEKIRKDVVKKAVDAIHTNTRQRYGAKDDAGMRASAKLSRRRNNYRSGYGHGISRVPRKIMSVRGTRFNWVAAVAPGTVGGRKAHPPKSSKIYHNKINAKENRLAIRSGIAASVDLDLVRERGHKVPKNYPFIADESIESISRTKELTSVLVKLGFVDELKRTGEKNIRAGKGKARGRRYNKKTGLLIVTGDQVKVKYSCSNILGFETVVVDQLNAKLLAPGGIPGRMILYTISAIERIEKETLFTEERVSNKQDKPLKTKNETKGKKAKKINNKQKLQMPKKLQTKDVANKVADKVQNIKSSSTIKSSSINKTVQNTAAKKAE